MSMRVRVCGVGDVPPGEMRAFPVDGLLLPVLVANLDGRFAAAASICPHEDVSLVDGDLVGTRVICPGHSYAFDLDTGRCAHDGTLRLRRFPVTLEGDDVWIAVDLFAPA
ncbi:MAG TPA: Rieske 2Fe-2S domain-containing protein [Kofleriaceae bacterium]|nr:Rieske 2Fe-2S domain-containing protein [Kofleriaceae bacterium]